MKAIIVFLSAGLIAAGNPAVLAESTGRDVLPKQVIAATSLTNVVIDPEEDAIGGSVSRAVFTNAVVNREPVDHFSLLKRDARHVYFFTELKGLTGETIYHRWELDGRIVAETPFEVGGPRWRVWSSHTLNASAYGEWRVSVVDINGHVIDSRTLVFTR